MNLSMIFLNSLSNSSRELYNSFCGHESFKKSLSQGRVNISLRFEQPSKTGPLTPLDGENKMADYYINRRFCSDDFIKSYEIIRSYKSRRSIYINRKMISMYLI